MCGILGYIGSIPQKDWPEAHRLLSNIFIKSRMRGTDAAGFSAIHDINSPVLIHEKRPICSGKLINRSAKYKALRRCMPKIFIGHTRASTSGPAKRNRNNHPFNSQRYSLVHNGGITGWENVARQIGVLPKMRTGCDSEILLHLLEEQEDVKAGIQHAMDSIPKSSRVATATLQYHPDLDKRLWLFRNDSNQVWMLSVAKWRTIFFASTSYILDQALQDTFGKEWKDVVKSYGIGKCVMPSWKLSEFGFDGDIPIRLNTFEISEKKMGFHVPKREHKKPIIISSKPVKQISMKEDLDLAENLGKCSIETQREITRLNMTIDEAIPVLKALRHEEFMQNCELDHFKKWMLKII